MEFICACGLFVLILILINHSKGRRWINKEEAQEWVGYEIKKAARDLIDKMWDEDEEVQAWLKKQEEEENNIGE